MNLLEIFDRPDQSRQYYKAKRPIAVLLSIFGIICMAISTPAGAYFLESLLIQFLPFGATVAAWAIAIGFDALLAIIAANFFADIFRGLDERQTYWDIPTILLLVVFLTASILASVLGADVRKARASQEVAKVEASAIDSTLMAVTTLATGDKLKVAPKGADKQTLRQIRKYNEQVNKAKETNKGKIETITQLAEKKQAKSDEASQEHHALIDFSKTVIVAAYLLLMVFIACVEYIKSKKPKQSGNGPSDHAPLNHVEAVNLAKGTVNVDTTDYLQNKNRVEINAFQSKKQKDEQSRRAKGELAIELRAKNWSLRKIGKELGVSAPTVSALIKEFTPCKV